MGGHSGWWTARCCYAEDGTALRVMVTIAPGDRPGNILGYEMDAS
jgi:hypothetical protein